MIDVHSSTSSDPYEVDERTVGALRCDHAAVMAQSMERRFRRELLQTTLFSVALVILGVVYLVVGWVVSGLFCLALCLVGLAALFWRRSTNAEFWDEEPEDESQAQR